MNLKRELQSETRMPQMLDLPQPYLLFLGDTTEKGYAKTAFGLRDWASDRCVGEWSCALCVCVVHLCRVASLVYCDVCVDVGLSCLQVSCVNSGAFARGLIVFVC